MRPERVGLLLPPYRVRDLISCAGLITQQMGTECSVTKTKTNPQLDYGSTCACVCVHVSCWTEPLWFLNRFLGVLVQSSAALHLPTPPPVAISVRLSTLGPRDPCIPPVLISHLNTILIVLTWTWTAYGGWNIWQALYSIAEEQKQKGNQIVGCIGVQLIGWLASSKSIIHQCV